MPEILYELNANEWADLKEVIDFIVIVERKKQGKENEKLIKEDKYIIAGSLLGLKWKSYLQQIERPKNNEKVLSGRSIDVFAKYYGSFKEDAVSNTEPNFREIKDKFYKLKIALQTKQKTNEFVYTRERFEPDSHKGSHSDFINTFIKRKWAVYTRIRLDDNLKIGRRILEFMDLENNSECKVELDHFRSTVGIWRGHAKFGAGNLLQIIIDNPDNYTHFFFQIENKLYEFDLGIGLVIFRHKKYDCLVSKTVILKRLSDKDDKEACPGTIEFDDPEAKELGTFFQDGKLNRITTSEDIKVYDHNTFKEWLKNNR